MPRDCKYRIEWDNSSRQGSNLRIEILPAQPRCILKLPKHWPQGAKELGGTRWLGSGGGPDVFGMCDYKCPEI